MSRLTRLIPAFTAGVLSGVINVIFAVSLAALIFSGGLAAFIPRGIGLILSGGLVAVFVIGLISSFPGTISITQNAPAAILAVMAAAIVQAMPSAAPQAQFITVVAAIALTSIITGLFFILLARFKLGGLVRFLPYPVVGGFLAGSGWLLITGGIGVMSGLPVTLQGMAGLFLDGVWQRWLPGLLIAMLILVELNRSSHPLLLPGLLLAVVLGFYAFVGLSRQPFAAISAGGWLLGPFPNGRLFQPILPFELARVDWRALLPQTVNLGSVVLVSTVALLLNASGIELLTHYDLDLNRELWAGGLGNLAGGLLGGMVSYHGMTDTTMNHKIGRDSHITGWVATVICILALISGAGLLSVLPKLLLGTVIIYFGLGLLYEWLYRAWFTFPRVEYAIILLIMLVTAFAGFFPGVILGLLVAMLLFVVNYSRIDVVKFSLSGADYHSQVTRSSQLQAVLDEHGDELLILQLQGFIFFGTANGLLERIRQRVRRAELECLRFVVLDFRHVTGLDSTAILSFTKMKQVAHENSITLIVSSLSATIRRQLEQGDFATQSSVTTQTNHSAETNTEARIFPDLDHALEWCEDQILVSSASLASAEGGVAETQNLMEQIELLLHSPAGLEELRKYLEYRQVPAGETLLRQGDAPDSLLFVEDGQVTAQVEQDGQPPMRLETMRGGRVVGELGFYLGRVRTASVVADEPSRIYRLTLAALQRMEQLEPEAASSLHRAVIHLLAERVTHLIRTVSALQR